MNVIIIEDEARTARQLERMLRKYDPASQFLAQLPSVSQAVAWFKQNPPPDLAFMDIHLEDGLAFGIFEQVDVNVPIIFTTAYDEYMIRAFKVNSIDYLLKPVDYDELAAALEKFKRVRPVASAGVTASEGNVPANPDLTTLIQLMQNAREKSYRERFMVSIGTKIRSVEVTDLAYFFSEAKATFLVTNEGQLLSIDYSLDQLEGLTNPAHFFRVNRQFYVARSAIKTIHAYSAGKLKLDLAPHARQEVFVSISRLSEFKDWLGR